MNCGRRIERFLSALLTEAPTELKVPLIAPSPMEPGTWVPCPALIQESCRLADCYEELVKRLGVAFTDVGKWSVELAFDGVHFSEVGHQIFAKGQSDTLKALR